MDQEAELTRTGAELEAERKSFREELKVGHYIVVFVFVECVCVCVCVECMCVRRYVCVCVHVWFVFCVFFISTV